MKKIYLYLLISIISLNMVYGETLWYSTGFTGGSSAGWYYGAAGDCGAAQSFTPNITMDITSIHFYHGVNANTPTQPIGIYLTADSSGKPANTNLSSGSSCQIAAATLSSYGEKTCTLTTPTTVTSGTRYWITWYSWDTGSPYRDSYSKADMYGGTAERLMWGCPYGTYSDNVTSTDFQFAIYYTSAPTDYLYNALTYPTDNLHLNSAIIPINYTINATNLINCSLYINGTLNQSQTSINSTTTPSKYFNYTQTTDGNYYANISCTDGTLTNTTSATNFVLDRVSPIWTVNTISTSNTTKIDRETHPWIYINDTIADTNLFAYNLTVYYPNGTIWFNNDTYNTTSSSINILRNETITTTQPNGTYSINYYAEDDHTALTIPDYEIIKPIRKDLIKQLEFKTTANIKIIPELDAISADTIKQTDRYNFEFVYPTTKPVREYHVTSDKIIYYRNNYNYPSFVTSKNWIDFATETKNKTYTITKISDYDYLITITDLTIKIISPKEETILFNSLGGLNIVNQTYTFEIKVNANPIIINTTPTQNFSVNDGSPLNFTTYATDTDNDSITYTYYFNEVLNYTGQNLTNFNVPYNSHGINNITVYASDGGKNDSYTWTINITHLNLPPIVNNVSYTPISQWYTNTNDTYITCSGYDQDNETNQTSLTYEIGYSTGGGWTGLITSYNESNTWKAYINITTLQGETLDARCRISDGEEYTAYTYLYDFMTIAEEYTALGEVSGIYPNGGQRDNVIPVICSLSSYGSSPSYFITYKLDAYYDSAWTNIGYGTNNKALFDMAKMDYNENVSFKCAAYDGITWTSNFTTNPVTRKHETKLIMFGDGSNEVMNSNTPYYKGLYADFYNEPGINIISSFADCNGDDFYDYYWPYTTNINMTKEYFQCYNRAGIIKHTVGVFINKTDSSSLLCGTERTTTCKIERTYGVLVK